jgi:hypothetical protein
MRLKCVEFNPEPNKPLVGDDDEYFPGRGLGRPRKAAATLSLAHPKIITSSMPSGDDYPTLVSDI